MSIEDLLVDSHLIKIGRILNLVWLEFMKDGAIYYVHTQCLFRFLRDDKLLASSNDVFMCKDETNEDWDWSEAPGESLFDDEIKECIIPLLPLKVTKVELTKWNDMFIHLAIGLRIDVIVQSLSGNESWRVFEKHNYERLEYVVYGTHGESGGTVLLTT